MTEKITGAATALLRGPISDLYEQAKDQVKTRLAPLRTAKRINNLYRKLSSVQKVKTIWQVDREINLRKFYYPSKLLVEQNRLTIGRINEIPYAGNVVISGTVGQGKSIFLRYLCGQELLGGKRIPLFIELRKVRKAESIQFQIKHALEVLGFDTSEIIFNYVLSSGLAILLLDGFDEIDPEIVPDVVKDLDGIVEKWPGTRIIVSSRPDSDIEKSQHFRIYKLAPLIRADHSHILAKLVEHEEDREEILKGLSTNPGGIGTLLTTPLMVTLLVMYFKTERAIPQQFSQFYENLFQTLLLRHDRTKPGFRRKRLTRVSERGMQDLFEGICYYSITRRLTTFQYDEIVGIARKSADALNSKIDPEDLIKDVCKITCLMVEESGVYHFIHKSVQEYHAASFIKHRPDISAEKFYRSVQKDQWYHWQQVLNFLGQIDEYRYKKLYLIPGISDLFNELDINPNENWIDPDINAVTKIVSKMFLAVLNAGGITIRTTYWQRSEHFHGFISDLLAMSARAIYRPNGIESVERFISEAKKTGNANSTADGTEIRLDLALAIIFGSDIWINNYISVLKTYWKEKEDGKAYIVKQESIIDPL